LLVGSGRDDAQCVLVSVRDSGPGLDPENLDRLFEAFHTNKPDGIGMGLAISRSIVEAHGGRLWATPNAPSGAVFQFTLPLEAGETSSSQHTQSSS
jgi:signal transduction histidine kinase